MRNPLRYNISSWDQLPRCQSNNSTDLSIHVFSLIHDSRLSGKMIQVQHPRFGVLFACLVGGRGPILSPDEKGWIPQLDKDTILKELGKFGFNVTFPETKQLPWELVSYLDVIDRLGFDKIRQIAVNNGDPMNIDSWTNHVVAFNVDKLPDWIHLGHSASKSEYLDALASGGAMALAGQDTYDWTWLNFVGNIQDILRDTGGVV